jgi:C4-dicarboxylate-specific signal transduction histidine kinase
MKRLRRNEAAAPGAGTERGRVPSRAELQEQLTELVEQRVAISELLRAIANSPHELQPIFDTILVNATRLCRAELGSLNLLEENGFRIVARSGPPDPYYSPREGLVLPVLPGNPLGRLVESRSPVQVADLAADQSYLERMPGIVALVEVVGVRTELLVPLLKDEELIGAIAMFRARVQPFTDKEIGLIMDFAAQATIALETTRRERQYRKVEMELAHANRVTTIGQLTASIAHEVNQPIAATVTNAEAALRWLDHRPPDVEEVRQALARLVKAAHRASDIIGRLRDLIKKKAPRKEVMDINEAIVEVTALTHGEAVKNGVTVRHHLAPGLPRIRGDRIQLQQVMLNLIVNAMQAMSGADKGMRDLQISTQAIEPESVRVEVRDTGPGLSPETLSHLFEPFYTTKPDGMGMGLSICRSIIDAHGGQLWATTCEPQGTLFQFIIPAN